MSMRALAHKINIKPHLPLVLYSSYIPHPGPGVCWIEHWSFIVIFPIPQPEQIFGYTALTKLINVSLVVLNIPLQTNAFNILILVVIFLNAITIAMETTSLSVTIPLFFAASDNIFLGIYLLEFIVKVF